MRSSCKIHQVLSGCPCLCAMDDYLGTRWSYCKGTCIVPSHDAIVVLFLWLLGCDQVMDVVTMDDYHGRTF